MNPNQSLNATSTVGYLSNRVETLYWQSFAESQDSVGVKVKAGSGIAPELYFKYIKKKFGVIEKMKLDARLKRLEKAFYKAVENGQIALGEKFMKELVRETRESAMYAKGIKHFIEMEDLKRYKHKIRGGHISDTLFGDFTRVIPDDVLAKKKSVEDLFDGFVIYHYWDEEAAQKAEKKEKMTPEEYSRMKDPVLFGVIKETNRLYFIAEWDDEFCDLSFEEIIDVVGGSDDAYTIPRNPMLKLE